MRATPIGNPCDASAINSVLREQGIQCRDQITWPVYEQMVERIEAELIPNPAVDHTDYRHPARLQYSTPERLRKCRNVRTAYTRFGEPSGGAILCLGGIANVARRFDCLAHQMSRIEPVVAMDWVGRGRSGWLPEQDDYSQNALVEQVLQLIGSLGLNSVSLVGSSLGGSVAMAIAAAHPELVRSIVLNDIGPFIPARRRSRRAQSIARHYVFRRPIDLFERNGAAQKNDGPVDDAILLLNSYHMTKWSEDEDGRIYRHDPRALAAYRSVAGQDHDQWDDWHRLRCPVLLVHGMCSDALMPQTIERMLATGDLDVIHVPDTGHTPTLTEPHVLAAIHDWLVEPVGMGCQTMMPTMPFPSRRLFVRESALNTQSQTVAA